MTDVPLQTINALDQTATAIAWCLAWGAENNPQYGLQVQDQMQQAISGKGDLPDEVQEIVEQVRWLISNSLQLPPTLDDLKHLIAQHSTLWNCKIGLVYGGATKIKQYVFEAAKLPDIRGASALLDRINLVDIPSFFGHPDGTRSAADWLAAHYPDLRSALIPQLLIYFKGGSILSFCPAAFVDQLANAIEQRYTEETLTANSCAVGATFRPLEIRFGLLQDPIDQTLWLDKLAAHWQENPALRAYFNLPEPDAVPAPDLPAAFANRKSFNELVGKLVAQFNLRRSGFDSPSSGANRPSRRYPPMLETHPYLIRDDSDRRSAVLKVPADQIPGEPSFSEVLARKRIVGQVTKREGSGGQRWYFNRNSPFHHEVEGRRQLWRPGKVISWVTKFKNYLGDNSDYCENYYKELPNNTKLGRESVQEARSLKEISAASQGFVAYIYADGNNMGQHIRDQIKTPDEYQQFSEDIFEATAQSVYVALAKHLEPHQYTPDAQSNRKNKNPVWIHPFEIVTIGGDDVLLIVPANQALAIAKTIGETFEEILAAKQYPVPEVSANSNSHQWHRYHKAAAPLPQCCLSLSTGVLITADNTPIYYADKLVSQLLKSAKKQAKTLRETHYYGGTVDFLTLKAVTMISSNIEAFRKEGLTIEHTNLDHTQVLKLYAAPYTLHELGGVLKTVEALKKARFPRSQLYQIRSLLEQGKRTSILNYRYFRIRLDSNKQRFLEDDFEAVWCEPETNNGNLAPWLTAKRQSNKTIYETIWRELVELEPLMDDPPEVEPSSSRSVEATEAAQ